MTIEAVGWVKYAAMHYYRFAPPPPPPPSPTIMIGCVKVKSGTLLTISGPTYLTIVSFELSANPVKCVELSSCQEGTS